MVLSPRKAPGWTWFRVPSPIARSCLGHLRCMAGLDPRAMWRARGSRPMCTAAPTTAVVALGRARPPAQRSGPEVLWFSSTKVPASVGSTTPREFGGALAHPASGSAPEDQAEARDNRKCQPDQHHHDA